MGLRDKPGSGKRPVSDGWKKSPPPGMREQPIHTGPDALLPVLLQIAPAVVLGALFMAHCIGPFTFAQHCKAIKCRKQSGPPKSKDAQVLETALVEIRAK